MPAFRAAWRAPAPFHRFASLGLLAPLARLARLAVVASSPAALGAQALRIRATEQTTGQPLAGAIADVVDAGGASAALLLLRDDGVRLVPLAAAGTYTVRIRRIGYEPFVSPPVTVAGTDTVDVALRVPARRVMLSAMRITGARRCAREASAAGIVATLLEEARKALTATALTATALSGSTATATAPTASAVGASTDGLVSRTFRRRLSVDGDELDVSVALPRRAETTRPFAAIGARTLSDSGYLRATRDGAVFFGPDAEVLLSDEFLRDHCFEAVAGRGASDGLLGVRFTPAPSRRRMSDIAGTLWVDSSSAELRYLDFWYVTTRLPAAALGEGRSGGRIVFESLPGGRWIVSAWHLRMPRFGTPLVTPRSRPGGYVESGGVVSGIAAPPEGLPPSLAFVRAPYEMLTFPARIDGVVFDSLHMRPLAAAEVTLTPTVFGDASPADATGDERLAIGSRVVVTDSAGRYLLDSIPAGTYRLTFSSPALDSAGALLPRYDVRLAPGALVHGDVTTPSRRTIAAGCSRPAGASVGASVGASSGVLGGGDGGLLFGTVRSDFDRLVASADVRVSWIELRPVPAGEPGARRTRAHVVEVVASTDRQGSYRVCGVPTTMPVSVTVIAARDTAGPFVSRLSSLGVRRDDFSVAPTARSARESPSATLRGVVHGPDGALLPNVRITLGVDSTGASPERPRDDAVWLERSGHATTSDAAGRFLLFALPAGPQTFTASLPGYLPVTFSAELRRHGVTTLELLMTATPRVTAPSRF